METRGRVLDWRFSLAETVAGIISAVGLAVGITLWSLSTFESKEDARESKLQMEHRIENVESQISTIRSSLEGVARDTSYIRGRLEPKNGGI